MPPLSPTKKKKASGVAKYGSSGPVIGPVACHKHEGLALEVRCVRVVVIVAPAVVVDFPLRKMAQLEFCGSRTGGSGHRVVYDSGGCAMRTRFEGE